MHINIGKLALDAFCPVNRQNTILEIDIACWLVTFKGLNTFLTDGQKWGV